MDGVSPPARDAKSRTATQAGRVSEPAKQNPPPSDQMRATGTGRRKVPLPPGRSQLDWIRNSRALPLPRPAKYTLEEVKKHNTQADAWTIVRGMVFNITPYLEYHPGGINMIMSGAGKDATTLFEKYHTWVNPSFMLERCFLGYAEDDADPSLGDKDDEGSTDLNA